MDIHRKSHPTATPLKHLPTVNPTLHHTTASANSSIYQVSSHISLHTPVHRPLPTTPQLRTLPTHSQALLTIPRTKRKATTNTQHMAPRDSILHHQPIRQPIQVRSPAGTTHTGPLHPWLHTQASKVHHLNSIQDTLRLVAILDSQVTVHLPIKATASQGMVNRSTVVMGSNHHKADPQLLDGGLDYLAFLAFRKGRLLVQILYQVVVDRCMLRWM